MWNYVPYDSLYHHGIKGMKWGVRRFQRKDGSLTSAGKKRRNSQENWSDDAKTAATIKKKTVNEMSNAELRKLNERKQLEQTYKNLNPGAIKKGMKIAGTIVATAGTLTSLYALGKKGVGLGKSASNKVIDALGNMVMNDLRKHING